MQLRKTLSLSDCDIKFSAGDQKRPETRFSGYASVFNGVDSYGDTILPEAYDTVIKSINGGNARMPKMFLNHRSFDVPLGKWTSLEVDEYGLKAEGELTEGNPTADVVKASLAHGTIDGLSIGFRIAEDDVEIVQEKGAKRRIIKNISELVEISVVTFPADDDARVDLASVKSALSQVNTIRDLELFLRDAGLPKSVAIATASQARRLFSQRDSEATLELPTELRQLIAANLNQSRI
jgi:HK97 family phage prohead protease